MGCSNADNFDPAIVTDNYSVQGNGGLQPIAWKLGYFVADVKRYGATGDGVTDDSAAIRLAVAAAQGAGGGTVYFPDGTYLVSRFGGATVGGCIEIPSNVTLLGQSRAGAIIKLANAQPVDTRVFTLNAVTDANVYNLTINGNKANQNGGVPAPDQHRAGIFCTASTRVRFFQLTIFNCHSDGIGLHDSATGARDQMVEQCYLHDNGRYGIVIHGGGQKRITVKDCRSETNFGDAFHMEFDTTPVDKILIEGNYFEKLDTDPAVTLRGANTDTTEVRLVGNYIRGGVFVNIVDGAYILDNLITTPATAVVNPILIQQEIKNCVVRGNHIVNEAGNVKETIYVLGAAGINPTNVIIDANYLYPTNVGIYMENATAAQITNNYISGAPATWGVLMRPSTSPAKAYTITDNHIIDCVNSVTVKGDNTIQTLICCDNTFEKINAVTNAAIDLDNDLTGILQQCSVIGNQKINIANMFGPATGGISITGFPTCPVLIGGNRGDRGIYSCSGTPEGVITENVGAVALRRDGAGATLMYLKISGVGNTGWSPVTTGQQVFQYIATGAEANPFTVNLPAARASANYNVQVSMGGPQANTIKIPRTLKATYTVNDFKVETSAPLEANDVLEFTVQDLT